MVSFNTTNYLSRVNRSSVNSLTRESDAEVIPCSFKNVAMWVESLEQRATSLSEKFNDTSSLSDNL